MKPNEPNPGAPLRVAIAVFAECDPSVIYGIFDTLWAAGVQWQASEPLTGGTLFKPQLVAATLDPIRLVTGVSILPQLTVEEMGQADIVIVPNVLVETPDDVRALDRRMIDWIVEMYRGGAQLYASCGGALVLAEAGLLENRAATTHWLYAPLLREEFPSVDVQPEKLMVQSGPGHSITCAGGASSWQDMALYLIARHGSVAEAIRISKIFLYQWHRDGQLPYASMVANVRHGDAVIVQAQEKAALGYERKDILAEIVAASGLSQRTFDRRFRAATGYSPLAYLQALRIEEAKQMLETGDLPVDTIAAQVGYEDLASFRRLFGRLTGMPPGAYRRKFNIPAVILKAQEQ
ncbi:GlxA family transcriptional regulator [Lacibacterium aquatile]|uniref:GlxA family transcriptional regulator n=1 Tax=Lacibacterium aquatile TaxID=1168082 RepID=A0ABW5DU23_9PROT